MDNLYILTSLISSVTAFSFLFLRGKLNISSQMGVFLASSLGVVCLSPLLLKIDYSNFSTIFCIYMILAGVFRYLSLVIMLEVVRKTSVERYSAVNPINIFASFLIFSAIDYSNTIYLIQYPLKFLGIVGSIIGIISVLIMSKKDKNFMETFKIFFPEVIFIGLMGSFIRLAKLDYNAEACNDYIIFMNFMMFFIPTIALLPSQLKEIKLGKLKNGDNKFLLFAFCVLFFADKCLINISYAIAPNPGYALAINTSAVVLIASMKDKFINIKKENNFITVSSVLLLALSMVYFTNL